MPGNIPDEIWLFRIVHIDNLPFLLERGMFASTHPDKDPDYVFIGDTKLTEQRRHYPIPLEGRGHIGEYVAFYFGHLSPMLYNIHTGYRGIVQRPQSDIVYICCTLGTIEAANCNYLFTDGHAKQRITQFYKDKSDLEQVDWDIVYQKYWRNDEEDRDRMRRKQAELLVKGHVPVSCIYRLVVFDDESKHAVSPILANLGLNLDIYVNPKGKFYY
jgi:prepilin-type processing-associated H-X9-DG protein